ncbi:MULTISPECIES: hypothetical protein [Rahnella]|uniref:hypothetical protein n=1 Tax=Rahnella TaxID=34037 RepID=UPI0012E2F5E3|nr:MULTISPECIES: hypothetical protein [Rahnella]MBB6113912.1 hypothetical protein [Rahnella inusitata]MBU9831224.1 hypothetical protein [Rahnella rivi]
MADPTKTDHFGRLSQGYPEADNQLYLKNTNTSPALYIFLPFSELPYGVDLRALTKVY